MKKEFIRDNGKIRNCESNVAKMNIIEFLRLDTGKFVKELFATLYEVMCHFVTSLRVGITILVCLALLPLTLLIRATVRIHSAKKEVKRQKKEG